MPQKAGLGDSRINDQFMNKLFDHKKGSHFVNSRAIHDTTETIDES